MEISFKCNDWNSDRFRLARLFHSELWEIAGKAEESGDPEWEENLALSYEWDLTAAAIQTIRTGDCGRSVYEYTLEEISGELIRLIETYIENPEDVRAYVLRNLGLLASNPEYSMAA